MLFDLPSDDTLFDALLRRDRAYDGRAFVGVTSTGVFCRLTCPARKPRRENCRFFENSRQCIEAGFRPCKRCHPSGPAASSDPVIASLIGLLEQGRGKRWSEADLVTHGFDPSTVRRAFRRQFGITFLEMARQLRVRSGFRTLRDGGKVIDAQLDAGFDSPSAFRAAFAALIGVSPGSIPTDSLLKADWIDTPLGAMVGVSDARALHLLEFVDRKALPRELARLQVYAKSRIGLGTTPVHAQLVGELADYFNGNAVRWRTDLVLHGTGFSKSVWAALRDIPVGETRSYSDIARSIGQPGATRAVARANGANQIALLVPCHRVIGADGGLAGYGGGIWRKQALIEIERLHLARAPTRTCCKDRGSEQSPGHPGQ